MSATRLFGLALAAASLPAQDPVRLSGPVSGFLFDAPTRAIRVVMGVPGAAYLGAATLRDIDNGAISPDGRLVLAIAGAAASLARVGDPAMQPLVNSGCEGALAAWAADSSAVAVVCAGRIRLFRAAGGSEVPLAAFTDATAVAVESGGRRVFAAAADGVYRVDAEAAQLLAPVAGADNLIVSGSTLFVADRAAGQVLAIDAGSGAAAVRVAATGAGDPVGLAVSPDGTRLHVADGEGKAVKVFDARTGEPVARVELDFAPARVDPLGDGLFLVHSRRGAGESLQILDARRSTVSFLPTL